MRIGKYSKYVFSALLLFGVLVVSNAWAQEVLKHPRVVELEDRMNKDAAAYIKARFPEVPFMVVVRVDPLRREAGRASEARAAEGLPYFEAFEDDEELRDEWDNPQVPLMALLNRVRKVSVQISVPAKLNAAEVDEMRDGIFNILHLTPARDAIEVNRREWAIEEVPWLGVYLLGAALLALLIGLLVINRTSANRIARALTEMKVNGNGAGQDNGGGGASIPVDREVDSARKSGSQEVKFNDPIKMKELASGMIAYLIQSKAFPNHHDVYIFDALGKRSPQKLGALLMELPTEIQAHLFSYTSGTHWIQAMNEPGFLDFECIETLQSISQNERTVQAGKNQNTILSVWRLGDERAKFLRTLQRDEAFALLAEMPKSIAVSEARKAFPGAWGEILDPNFKPKDVSEKRMEEIFKFALLVAGLRDISLVRRYRSEKEILEYVRFVDPVEEREVYEAANTDSLLLRMRPPFYPVFSAPEAVQAKVVTQVSIEQWSLALFNVLKSDRTLLEKHLNEKQRFLLIERFKRFDQNPPTREQIALARELVGIRIRKLLKDDANKVVIVPEKEEAPKNEAA